MRKLNFCISSLLVALIVIATPRFSAGWHDETHIAIAKATGYHKWFNATGADMAKLKAEDIERHNHYVNNPAGTVVTPEMVLSQAEKYNQVGSQRPPVWSHHRVSEGLPER